MFDIDNLEKYVFYRKHDFKKIVEENGLPCTPYEFMKHRKMLDENREELMEELRTRINYSIRYEPLSQTEIQALQVIWPHKFYDNQYALGNKEESKALSMEQVQSLEELEEKNELALKETQDIITNEIVNIKENQSFLAIQKKWLEAWVRVSIVWEFYWTNYYINIKDPVNSLNAITGEWSDNIILHQAIEHFRNQ